MKLIKNYIKNYAKYLLKFYTPDFLFKKIPKEIIIEPTNICNLKCPVCPTNFAMTRNKGFMDFELFKSIINEFIEYNDKPEISMNFSGEPLLNKSIYKFIKYASDHGHNTYISTNATAINEKNSTDMIKSGLSDIHLCIDGFSNKSHDTYRVGSDFNVIKKNIEIFLETKNKLNKKNPNVVIQTLITSLSENEEEEMIKWAKEIGADSINFKSLSMGSYTTEDMKKKYNFLLPKNKNLRRKQTSYFKSVCTIPYHQSVIYWNGNLGLCCIDFNNKVSMPNIRKDGFIKTLLSDDVIKLRKKGFQKKYGICTNCSLGNADFMGSNHSFSKKENINKANLV